MMYTVACKLFIVSELLKVGSTGAVAPFFLLPIIYHKIYVVFGLILRSACAFFQNKGLYCNKEAVGGATVHS